MTNRVFSFFMRLIKQFIFGASFGLGFFFVAFILMIFLAPEQKIVQRVLTKLHYLTPAQSSYDTSKHQQAQLKNNPYQPLLKAHQQIVPPRDFKRISISSTKQFLNELKKLEAKTAFYFEDGTYRFNKPISINKKDVMLLSRSQDPRKVTIIGRGMHAYHKTFSLITVNKSGFVLDGITLAKAPNHIIQIRAENNANFPVIRNCIIEDGYEQLIKVSYDKENRPENASHTGIVEYCVFRYTKGIGSNYYIGGIDAHAIKNWTIRHNLFLDIASPGKRIAEHAIHIWNNSEGTLVENNIIIDSDRAIGFGMKKPNVHKNIKFSNYGGIIQGNYIYHSDNGDEFADTGIVLEDSPYTKVLDNYIFLEHDYRRAIEYRFNTTHSVTISDNRTNKSISSRNSGKASLSGNKKVTQEDYNKAFAKFIETSDFPDFLKEALHTN